MPTENTEYTEDGVGFFTTDGTDITDDWMLGDQGNIRAIRVIRGENGLEDWLPKAREVTKMKTAF